MSLADLTTTPLLRPSTNRTPVQVEGNSIRNRLLLDLPARECNFIYPQLSWVEIKRQDVLQECEEPVKYAYFIENGVASVLNVTEDGRSLEVGMFGKEGCTGLPLVAGLKTSLCRIVVQIGGTAFRIATPKFVAALAQCPRLQRRVQQYSQIGAMQSAQIACCNRLHEVDGRLARWLLMCHDRSDSDLLPLTQEFMAHMLGTRRSSVTVAAGVLQQAGLIRYVRGSVKIADRPGLEQASCECYQLLRKHTDMWATEATVELGPELEPAGRLAAGRIRRRASSMLGDL